MRFATCTLALSYTLVALAGTGVPSDALAQAPIVMVPSPQDAPVISDQDFDAALPPLDVPSLDPVSPQTEPPEPRPDQLPDIPPETDEALIQALPSLADFDKTPAPAAIAADEDKDPEIAYDTKITGLTDISNDRGSLQKQFWDLSALKEGKGKAANAAMVQARLKQDEVLALRLLKSEGYYDAVITSSVEPRGGIGSAVDAVLNITPGQAYSLDEIIITANPTVPETLIRESLPLKTGDSLLADRIVAAEANVSLKLPENGYPFAEVQMRDILLDTQSHTADYTLPVDTGPRARIGQFRSEGREAFDVDHINVIARMSKGDLYDSRMVDDLRQALVATNLFRSVSVEPVRTNTPSDAGDGTEYVDILVRQQIGRVRTLAADAGYSTGQGYTIKGSWIHRNFRRPEGALIIEGIIGTEEQGISSTFRRSNFKKRDRTLTLTVLTGREDTDTFEAYNAGFKGSLALNSSPIWQKRWTWSYGLEILATRERAVSDVARISNDWTDYYTATVPIKYGRDVTDNLLNPTKGFRASLEIAPQVSLDGSTANTLRNVLDGSIYRQVTETTILAARMRIGTILGGTIDDVPLSRRFYGGGGGSVRGFGYQELGPRDITNTPTGGRSLIELAFEARYRLKNILGGNLGIVPFIDVGQVYQDQMPSFDDIRVGIGIGARYYTNFGPLRVDIATPLGRREGESPVALYVGIGQAF